MVVRELERDAAAQAAKKHNDAGMLRVLDCFDQGVCFVDTSAAKWQGMHCNSALAQVGSCRSASQSLDRPTPRLGNPVTGMNSRSDKSNFNLLHNRQDWYTRNETFYNASLLLLGPLFPAIFAHSAVGLLSGCDPASCRHVTWV